MARTRATSDPLPCPLAPVKVQRTSARGQSPAMSGFSAEMVCRIAVFSMRGMLVLLAAVLSLAGLSPAAYHEGHLDAEVHRLHEAVGKAHELSLERRLDIAARAASLVTNQLYCKTGEVNGPSCVILEKNAEKVMALKDWASRSEGWERSLAALSLFHVGRGFWYQENYDRSLLAVEQSIALKLFPYQTAAALESWQRALVHPKSGYTRQRQELADSLVLQADCLLEMGQGDRNIAQLEKAMHALQLAAALVHNNKESSSDTYTQMTVMAMQIASAAVDVLNRLRMSSIHELMDTHGVTCKGCTDKGALLRQLVSRLNLPVVMLSDSSPLISPLEDPLANEMLPTLKSPKETQQQYMRRQFRSLLGMVHSHLLEELQVDCARRTQEDFCASYLPPWTWESAGSEAAPPSSHADASNSCSGRESRTCTSGECSDVAGAKDALGAPLSSSNDSDRGVRSRLPACQSSSLPCMADPNLSSSHWTPSGAAASEAADSVHLGGVDTIIFTSSGQPSPKPASHSVPKQGAHAQGGGSQQSESEHDGAGGDPRAAKHYSSSSFHDAIRETLDRQLREQLAKKADAASQHDDPLVLLTLFGCILACLGLYLYIKHKRRISRFLQSHRGWLSASSAERPNAFAYQGASGANPLQPTGIQTPSVMQSRKAVAALLREALAGQDVTKVQAALEAAQEAGLEPSSSLLSRAQAFVQQRKKKEKSQHQGTKAVSGKKEKRKVKATAEQTNSGSLAKEPDVARSEGGGSNSSFKQLSSHEQPKSNLWSALLWPFMRRTPEKREDAVTADDTQPDDSLSQPEDSPSSLHVSPPPSEHSCPTETHSTLGSSQSTSHQPARTRSTTKSTTRAQHSSTAHTHYSYHDLDHTDDWQETGKKTKQRFSDKSLSRRALATTNAAKAAINSTTLLSASILAQLPPSVRLPESRASSVSSLTTGTPPPLPSAYRSPASPEPVEPAYPPCMPIPTPVATSPQPSPTPSWLSWLSSSSTFTLADANAAATTTSTNTLTPNVATNLPNGPSTHVPATTSATSGFGRPPLSTPALSHTTTSFSVSAATPPSRPLPSSTLPAPTSRAAFLDSSNLPSFPNGTSQCAGFTNGTVTFPSISVPNPWASNSGVSTALQNPVLDATVQKTLIRTSSDGTSHQAPRPSSAAPLPARPVLYSQVVSGQSNQPKPMSATTVAPLADPSPAPDVKPYFKPILPQPLFSSNSSATFGQPASHTSLSSPSNQPADLSALLDAYPIAAPTYPFQTPTSYQPPDASWTPAQAPLHYNHLSTYSASQNHLHSPQRPVSASQEQLSNMSAPQSPYANRSMQFNHTTNSTEDVQLPHTLSPIHSNIPSSRDPPCALNAYDPLFPTYTAHQSLPPTCPPPAHLPTADAAPSYMDASMLGWGMEASHASDAMRALGGGLWDPMVSFDLSANEDAWSSNTKRLQEWLQVEPGVPRVPAGVAAAPACAANGVAGGEVTLGASPPDSLGDANEWIHDLLKHVMD